MTNSLVGKASYAMGWNPHYQRLIDAGRPEGVAPIRLAIAHHGMGHVVIQVLAGAQHLSVRMPSFSDTPHVEVSAPCSVPLPCGIQDDGTVRDIDTLCYHLGGYLGEYAYDQGEHRDIAGFHDYESAIDIADRLNPLVKGRISVQHAAALVVTEQHGRVVDVIEKGAYLLRHRGFIDWPVLKRLMRPYGHVNFATLVLEKAVAGFADDEDEWIDRTFS